MPSPSAQRSRTAWIALADSLVESAQRHMSPDGSMVRIPGAPSKHGRDSDGTEGFARLLLLHSWRLAGAAEAPARHTDRFLEGLDNGLRAHRGVATWIDVEDRGHAIPEAASIALALAVAPDALWAPLSDDTRGRIVDWLTAAARAEPFDNNWVMFGFAISAFLETAGAHPIQGARERALDRLAQWQQRDGWIADGLPGGFDYYSSFALHYYPLVIAHLLGDHELIAERRPHTARFLEWLAALIADNGAPTYFGRSLTYRWAVTSTVSAAALTNCLPWSPREAHALTSDVVDYFTRNGAIAPDGTVRRGWHGQNRRVAEHYSGPAASYWLAKPFADLLLPADSEYWSGPPGERPRSVRVSVAASAGLLVQRGAQVRLANHGSTDRSGAAVSAGSGSLNYGAVEYSSATAPVAHALGHAGGPTLDFDGALARRAVTAATASGERWAASRGTFRRAGSPDATVDIATISLGEWLVHGMRLIGRGDERRVVTWSGLALAAGGDAAVIAEAPTPVSAVADGDRWSVVAGLAGWSDAGVADAGATAFATSTRVPFVTGTAGASGWWIVATYIGGTRDSAAPSARVLSADRVEITCTHGARVGLRWDGALFATEPEACCA